MVYTQKEKWKPFCLLDFHLILEGWVVGFEPTTFRTTSGNLFECYFFIISVLVILCISFQSIIS